MKAKLGAIFIISFMALAGTGAAYALWYEDLYIWTDVHTGTVDVHWSLGGTWSNQLKDVSTMNSFIVDTDDHIAPLGTLYCEIFNAYPCVEYWFYFDVHNIGSIPVHFTPLRQYDSGYYPMVDPAWIEDLQVFITRIEDTAGNVLERFNPPELIQWVQLHPGEVAFGYYMVHFNNNLPQGTLVYLDMYTRAHQYNEGLWGPLNKPAGG
jgi:hypothetical protein